MSDLAGGWLELYLWSEQIVARSRSLIKLSSFGAAAEDKHQRLCIRTLRRWQVCTRNDNFAETAATRYPAQHPNPRLSSARSWPAYHSIRCRLEKRHAVLGAIGTAELGDLGPWNTYAGKGGQKGLGMVFVAEQHDAQTGSNRKRIFDVFGKVYRLKVAQNRKPSLRLSQVTTELRRSWVSIIRDRNALLINPSGTATSVIEDERNGFARATSGRYAIVATERRVYGKVQMNISQRSSAGYLLETSSAENTVATTWIRSFSGEDALSRRHPVQMLQMRDRG
ncbi:hypothetical protein B0H14DRAFT_3135786 [Mycena olivaceomarginata]|nr:hypothetical protein B0H14DRAFT_3135786 [Mycena olivaceomarginata]